MYKSAAGDSAKGRTAVSTENKWNAILKSSDARERGNELFRLACAPGLSPAVQTLRFEKALKEYVAARSHAPFDEQLSSASKNIGSVHWRLAVLHAPEENASTRASISTAEVANRTRRLHRFLGHASDAELNLKRAWTEGNGKSPDWCKGILDHLETVIAVTKDMLVAGDSSLSATEEDFAEMNRSLRTMNDCHIKAFLCFLIGVVFFKKGVAQFSSHGTFDFVPCLSAMSESRPLLFEAGRLASINDDEELNERIASYVEQVDMQQSVCESRQAVAEGDRLLGNQLEDEERPNMDMIWTIVDMYRQGILLARERCLESEAIAHSRLGVVYHKVLKLRGNAKKCFEVTLDLADSLYPKDLSGDDWYIDAEIANAAIAQAESRMKAEELAGKEKLKGEIKDLLDPIEKIMDKGVDNVTKIRSLLKHIYATHPPKLKSHQIGALAPSKLRNTLTKTIMHYHTDTQQRYRPKGGGASLDSKGKEIDWGDVGSFDKWELLCGEICRHLNFLYTYTYKS